MPISLETRLPRTYHIESIEPETEAMTSMTLPVSLGANPGQFLMVWLPGIDQVPLAVADDDDGHMCISFAAIGDLTKKLAHMHVGDLVGLSGPFGTSFTWKRGSRLVMLAGGYGVAPIFFAAKRALRDDCRVDVIIGARNANLLAYRDRFAALAGLTLHVTTDDGSVGRKGFTTEVLRDILEQSREPIDAVFACGPEPMMLGTLQLTTAAGVRSQLSFERYMKCGYGLCGSWAVDPTGLRLCTDGPVMTGEVASQITEFGNYHRDKVGEKKGCV